MRVLVVDDDATSVLPADALTDEGHEVAYRAALAAALPVVVAAVLVACGLPSAAAQEGGTPARGAAGTQDAAARPASFRKPRWWVAH